METVSLTVVFLNNFLNNICGFYPCGFNQLQVKNIQKNYIVADVFYVVRPMLVASVLNRYRVFFLSLFTNNAI